MKESKVKITVFGLIVLVGLVFSLVVLANSNSSKFKPIPARDVQIIKKSTLKGKPVSASGSKITQAATGVLGKSVIGKKYAIVIGISNYPGTAYDLKYADDDAQVTIDTLKSVYGFASENISALIDEGNGATTTISTNATADNIQNAILKIKGLATVDDEVVFFFSGHGGIGIAADGDNERTDESIIAHDGAKLVHIWDGQLKQLFDGFATSRIIFIFDSCASGGMTDLAADGRVINMATKELGLTTAVELDSFGSDPGQGELTYYFVVQGMAQGLADKYDHDIDTILGEQNDVVVEEAFDYTKKNVDYDVPTIKDQFTDDLLL